MSDLASPSLESIASSMPQVRLATQVETLSTQVQNTWRVPAAAAYDETRRIAPTAHASNAAARATLQMLCDGDLNSRPRPKTASHGSGSNAMKPLAAEDHGKRAKTAKQGRNEGSDLPMPIPQPTDGVRVEATESGSVDRPQGSQVNGFPQAKAPGANIDDDTLKALRRLGSIWGIEEHYGIPTKWRTTIPDKRVLIPYLNLCQQVKDHGKSPDILWTRGSRYLETACEDEGRLCSRAIEKAAKRIKSTQILPPGHPLASSPSSARGGKVPSPRSQVPGNTKHAVKEKSVIRRHTKVPKDQVAILDSPQSHYPPLPGQDERPGAMPVKLLQLFTAQVDEAAQRNEPTVPSPTARQQQPPELEETDTNVKVNELVEESTDSEQEVSSSQWPASPDRGAKGPDHTLQEPESSRPTSLSPVVENQRKAQLPPDSSPPEDLSGLGSDRTQATGEDMSTANESTEEDTCTKIASSQSSRVRSTASTHRAGGTHSGGMTTLDLDNKSKHPDSRHQPPQLSMEPRDPEQAHSSGDVPVQIKRTPYPGKYTSSTTHQGLGASQTHFTAIDGPASTFIPSTYQENTIDTTQNEMRGVGARALATPTKRSAPPHQPPQDGHGPAIQAQQIQPRGVSGDLDLTSKVQAAREYRRSVLKPISKKPPPSQQIPKAAALMEAHSHHQSSSPSVEGSLPKAAPQSIVKDTPTAFTSSIAPLVPTRHVQEAAQAPATEVPPNEDLAQMALFQRFLDAYPDYTGSKKQFGGACRLLLKHCSQRQLHSFLLDDFVFHYTQSYPTYFIECHESGEEALSYTDYFDTIAPTHMKKVISVPDVKEGSSRKDSNESATSDRKKRSVPKLQSFEGEGNSEGSAQIKAIKNSGAAASRAIETGMDPLISTVSKQQLQSSQKSSVEEWLEHIMASRPGSPELGTPDIDRSLSPPLMSEPIAQPKSLKRSLAFDSEHTSTLKRTRLSSAPVRPESLRLPQATPASSKPRYQAPSSTGPAATSLPKQARPLPPSFDSARKSMTNAAASAPRAVASGASQTPSKPPGRPTATQPLRQSSTHSTPLQKRAHSSKPASSSPFVKKPSTAGSINIVSKPTAQDRSQDEDTPFKRFAAAWRKLPPMKSAALVKQQCSGGGGGRATGANSGNTYAMLDVTQWRK